MTERSPVHYHPVKAFLLLVVYMAVASGINTCEFAVSIPETPLAWNIGAYVDYDETTDKYYMVKASIDSVLQLDIQGALLNEL